MTGRLRILRRLRSAIVELDEMEPGDGELSHSRADELLLLSLGDAGGTFSDLANAFRSARSRCFEGFYS